MERAQSRMGERQLSLTLEQSKIGVRKLPNLLNKNPFTLIVILLLTLGASCHSDLYDESAFPPCMKASEAEIEAIQSLGYVFYYSERDHLLLNLLARTARFCEAYHARIGYSP